MTTNQVARNARRDVTAASFDRLLTEQLHGQPFVPEFRSETRESKLQPRRSSTWRVPYRDMGPASVQGA